MILGALNCGVDFGSADKIVFGQPPHFVRCEHHRAVTPAKCDVGVMAFFIADIGYKVGGVDGFGKGFESEFPG
jgi:hypothetical protein